MVEGSPKGLMKARRLDLSSLESRTKGTCCWEAIVGVGEQSNWQKTSIGCMEMAD